MLEALDHADAVDAAEALSHLEPAAYRRFNLIVADKRDGFWLRHAGAGRVEIRPLKEGLSLIAAGDLDDFATRRPAAPMPGVHRPPPIPVAAGGGPGSTCSDLPGAAGAPAAAAMRLRRDGYGTVSSALIALPARLAQTPPVFRYAGWLPEQTSWQEISLA